MYHAKAILLILFFGTAHTAPADGESALAPAGLACEYLVNPAGIDEPAPRLSWKLPDSFAAQSARRILVASDPALLAEGRADVYDSGRVETEKSVQWAYEGPALKPKTRYHWAVKVWDADGGESAYSKPAFWETGLMDRDAWEADWIGVGGPLEENVHPHTGYHCRLEKRADVTKWVQFALGEARTVGRVVLHPVKPFDYSSRPGFLFPVRFRVDVSNSPGFEEYTTVWDRTDADFPNPGAAELSFTFPETEAEYVRLMVTQLANREADNYAFALSEMEIWSDGKNVARDAEVSARDSIDQGEWKLGHINDGIAETQRVRFAPPTPCPMVRKEFTLPAAPRRARVYVTARGLYELRINGERVGDRLLAPEWTHYGKRIQYQTYDVTSMLRPGDNAVAAYLGEGWYAGLVGLLGPRKYGDQVALMMRLEAECGDGSNVTVVTDETWRGTKEGPLRGSDIIRGETYDATREIPGWDQPGFVQAEWDAVVTLPDNGAELVWQPNEPIRVTEELRPAAVTEPGPGVYVFDLGQNMVGWCRIALRGEPGQRIRIRHGEMLNPDGTLYTKNLRDENRQDPVRHYQENIYICKGGGVEIYEPRFTYHGFRYVEIAGLSEKPSPDDLIGRVFHSDAPIAGTFECSNPMLNQLMENIVWTQRGNLHSTPTDCPQRDERLGWMGDAQLFSQASMFNMDMAAFYTKWCADIRDAQTEDGRFSDFSPNPVMDELLFTAAPAWADAGVIVPWRMYVNYSDKRLLERHFDSARRWVDFVHRHNPDLIWRNMRGNDYGDWLNGDRFESIEDYPKEGSDTPRPIFATAFFAHSAELTGKMAAVLGRGGDAARYAGLARRIKRAFLDEFVSPDGRIESDTQSIYALALRFDLLPEELRPKALERLTVKIRDYGYRLSTGIQATNRMMLELADGGRTDLAYRLLTSREFPSWGYMIEQGATTIWERWDGYVEGRGFQNPGMNSFNHYALGAVGEWMYRNIVGVNPDPDSPGYKHFILRPRPGGGLTHAKGSVETPYGTIRNEWRLEDGRFAMNASVPPNTTATVYVPTSDPESLRLNGEPVAADGYGDGFAFFAAKAGECEIEADAPEPSAFVPVEDPGPRGVDWDAARRKAEAYPWAKSIVERMRREVERARSDYEHPPLGTTGWLHEYFCDDDANRLIYDPEKPTEHVCSKCGKVYSGPPYDDCWRSMAHSDIVSAALDAAALYRLTGERHYFEYARDVLLWYADHFGEFEPHGDHAGKGIVREQSLDEATQLTRLAETYWDIAKDLDEMDRIHIANRFLIPDAEFIHKQTSTVHNIHSWHNAAVALVGMALGKEELVKDAVQGEYGLVRQIRDGVLGDGFWYEGSISYHYYTISSMQPLYLAALAQGMNPEGMGKFPLMYTAPARFAFPNGEFPANNDGWPGQSIYGRASYYEAASQFVEDPLIRGVLAAIYERENRDSREALLYGPDTVAPGGELPDESVLFEDSGFAILRNDFLNAYLKFGPYGGGHDHLDRLNLILFGLGDVLIPDLGTPGYGIPLNQRWYRSSAAHNMLIVDGNRQARCGGYLVSFDGEHVHAGVRDAYPGVDIQRRISMLPIGIADQTVAVSGEEHRYDLIHHVRGDLVMSGAEFEDAPAFEEGNGYDVLREIKRARDLRELSLRWKARDADGFVEYQCRSDEPFDAYVGTCPDMPADREMSFVMLRQTGREARFDARILVRPE